MVQLAAIHIRPRFEIVRGEVIVDTTTRTVRSRIRVCNGHTDRIEITRRNLISGKFRPHCRVCGGIVDLNIVCAEVSG